VVSEVAGTASTIASQRPTAASRSRSLVLGERKLLLFVTDLGGTTIGLLAAVGYLGQLQPERPWISWTLLLAAVWIVCSAAFDAYDLRACSRAARAVLAGYRPLLATFVIYLAIPYATPPLLNSRLAVLIWFMSSLMLVGAGRFAYARMLTRPQFQRRAIVVGDPTAADELARALTAEAATDYTLLGWVPTAGGEGAIPSLLRPLADEADLVTLVRALDASEVIIAGQGAVPADLGGAIVDLYNGGVEVTQMADLYEQLVGRIPVAHVPDHWYAVLPRRAGGGRAYDLLRRGLDVVVAGVFLMLALPILLLVAAAIALDGQGPILYRQQRLGHLGHTFDIWKFRTMRVGAEREGDEVWAVRSDPRRTRVGRVLRPTRLDELPQLWNVFVGDMTLIGPRPERPGFTRSLQEQIPFYRSRLLVKPGVTGWAQVKARYASNIDDSLEKLQYDLYYVKHRSPYLDLVIALKSIGVLLRASGT
jgi:exopolysaccharide biosynthesis polyprenyl glycosylphosphotransferase